MSCEPCDRDCGAGLCGCGGNGCEGCRDLAASFLCSSCEHPEKHPLAVGHSYEGCANLAGLKGTP